MRWEERGKVTRGTGVYEAFDGAFRRAFISDCASEMGEV